MIRPVGFLSIQIKRIVRTVDSEVDAAPEKARSLFTVYSGRADRCARVCFPTRRSAEALNRSV